MTTRTALQRAAAAAAATAGLAGVLAAGGCGTTHVKVEPLEVKPITVNVNVNLRVQQQLEQFFSFEDKLLTGDATRPATAPSTATSPAAPPAPPSDGAH